MRISDWSSDVCSSDLVNVGQRSDLDALLFEQALYTVEAHQVIQRVEQWSQIGVDLLRQIAGQKAQAFTGFHRGAGQDQAFDGFAFHGVDGAGHRKPCLARTGRPVARSEEHTSELQSLLRNS